MTWRNIAFNNVPFPVRSVVIGKLPLNHFLDLRDPEVSHTTSPPNSSNISVAISYWDQEVNILHFVTALISRLEYLHSYRMALHRTPRAQTTPILRTSYSKTLSGLSESRCYTHFVFFSFTCQRQHTLRRRIVCQRSVLVRYNLDANAYKL